MIVFKGCPRCGGDVDATHEDDVHCIQCGCRPTLTLAELCRRGRRRMRLGPLTLAERAAAGGYPVLPPAAALETAPGAPADDGVDIFPPPSHAAHISADRSEPCPRCGEQGALALEKLRPYYNTCYRCAFCGHIFSPAPFKSAS